MKRMACYFEKRGVCRGPSVEVPSEWGPDATRKEGQPRRGGLQGKAQIPPEPHRSAGKIACGFAQRGYGIESREKRVWEGVRS
jgi:hypothetical protein